MPFLQYVGRRAFIIGNGPSLNDLPLHLMKDEVCLHHISKIQQITFGTNNIYMKQEDMGFLPTFYVVEDEFVAEDRNTTINALKGMINTHKQRIPGPTKFFGTYLQRFIADGPDVVWLPVHFHYPHDLPIDWPPFGKNAGSKMFVGGTVSYVCLQLAYYMGFSQVYLIGFDHSYVIPKAARVSGTEIVLSTDTDPNHFAKEYFGKNMRWHDPRTDRMEMAYGKTLRVFGEAERSVFNAGIGGKLEVFPRIEFGSLFPSQPYHLKATVVVCVYGVEGVMLAQCLRSLVEKQVSFE